VPHEISNSVEGFAIVIEKNASVDAGMYDEEKNQKKTGEGHSDFLAYGRGEEMFPGHKNAVD
jgi:hypothetical protein